MTLRTRSRLKKLALSAAVFLAGLCLAELGFRGWLRWRGTPYDSGVVERRLRDAVDPIAAFVPRLGRKATQGDGQPVGILHPFTGSESEHDTSGVLEHFRRGVPEDEYTVLVVGGSVAGFFAVSGGPELEQLLARDPRLAGRTVRVLNYAHAAYKEPQQLMRLAYLFSLGYRPDAVINLDGFNEIALAYENATLGTSPLYPSYPVWGVLVQDFGALDREQLDLMVELWQLRTRARELVDGSLRWKLYASSLTGRLVDSRLAEVMNRRFEVQTLLNQRVATGAAGSSLNRQLNGPDFTHGSESVFGICTRNWFESSISIQALCQARGTAYLHVLQPTLHDPGAKALSAEERALAPGPAVWQPAVVYGYPLLRERAKLFQARGVKFLDASHAFADVNETLYDDACHFAPRGNVILARFIAPYFLEHVLGPAGTGLAREGDPRALLEGR